MRKVTNEEISRLCPPRDIVGVLRDAFVEMCTVPERLIYDTSEKGHGLLIMPAWGYKGFMGIKLITSSPDNTSIGLPFLQGMYVLIDHATGTPIAHMPAGLITNIRTSATSALAASYLAHPESKTLLMIGAGSLAPFLIKAHSAVRDIEKVYIWSRTGSKALKLAEQFENAEAVGRIEDVVRECDIISCATGSTQPLVQGEWLRPGQHIDLVGGYKPEMRETDDLVIARSEVYVDTEDAFLEAGDLIQPLKRGTWRKSQLKGYLPDLCSGKLAGREDNLDIVTLFKSVGHAVEDIATAVWIWQQLNQEQEK